MSDALQRAALADAERPFALDGRGHEAAPVERLGESRMPIRQRLEIVAADFREAHLGEPADAVVHLAQDEDVLVAEIPGQEIGNDLPAAVLQHLVAAGPAVEHEVDVSGPVAFADDVLARLQRPHPAADHLIDHPAVVGGQPRISLEPQDKRIEHLYSVALDRPPGGTESPN